MTNKAIQRLHNDLHALTQAQKASGKVAQAERKAEGGLKTAKRSLKSDRDGFDADQKALKKDQLALAKLRDSETSQIDAIEAQKVPLQQQYDASIDPATGEGDPAIKAQLDALDAQQAQVKASFDSQIAAKAQEIATLQQQAAGKRSAVHNDLGAIKTDGRDIKHDQKSLAHAKGVVKRDRKKALKDLTPAEYKMGLKATNEARKELGLKPVKHVIRLETAGLDPSKMPAQYRKWIPYVESAAKRYHLPPALIFAVMSRETNGVNEVGDYGHGRGLMQVDDRSWGSWLASHDGGMDPASNIMKGAEILRSSIDYFHGNVREGVAAYNAGAGNVEAAVRAGHSPDYYTTGGNYSADVLKRENMFR